MIREEDLFKAATVNAEVGAKLVMVVANLLNHVVSALADQPGIDRELLIKQIRLFPDPKRDDFYRDCFLLLKDRLLSDISKQSPL